MPRISAFYGIVIAMYFGGRPPPHLHARYGEHEEITAVEHLGGHRLRLTFADGFSGDVDLSERFQTPMGPIFEPLWDERYFAKVAVDPELGTVVWPDGADLAPDVLHQQALSLA